MEWSWRQTSCLYSGVMIGAFKREETRRQTRTVIQCHIRNMLSSFLSAKYIVHFPRVCDMQQKKPETRSVEWNALLSGLFAVYHQTNRYPEDSDVYWLGVYFQHQIKGRTRPTIDGAPAGVWVGHTTLVARPIWLNFMSLKASSWVWGKSV